MNAAVKALELAGIIYCTFENVQGSIIECQYPDDCITTDNFKLIFHAVIPRADLTDKAITIAEFGHFIIGFPQRIEGTQYSRNTLLFNVCFIVKSRDTQWQHFDLTGYNCPRDFGGIQSGLQPALQSAYELTVRKINRYLAYMELENAALSQGTLMKTVEDNGETLIHRFLRQIYTDLREKGLCVTDLGDNLPSLYLIFSPRTVNNTVSSYFTPTAGELPSVSDITASPSVEVLSRVPLSLEHSTVAVTDATVFVRVRPLLSDLGDRVVYALLPPNSPLDDDDNDDEERLEAGHADFWEARDLVSSRLLPLIDGRRSVAQVATLAAVDRSIARLCFTQLLLFGVVRVVAAPVFLAEGRGGEAGLFAAVPGYVGTPRLLRLTVDEKLRDACFHSVLCQSTKRRRLHLSDPEGLIIKILQVYSKICASPHFSLVVLVASTRHFIDLHLPFCAPLTAPGFLQDDNGPGDLPRVSLLRLIQFGEVNSLIHRLHCYPISETSVASAPPCKSESSHSRLWTLLRDQMMDGTQSVDELVYEASAWATKSALASASASSGAERVQMPTQLTTTLSDAVVSFTAALLKEQASLEAEEERADTENRRDLGGRRSEPRNMGSSQGPGGGIGDVSNNALHLLWH